MSNRNDGSSEFAMTAGILAASALLLFFVFYVLALIVAIGFTVIAVCAWNKPRRIAGHVITPAEARFFVHAGMAGTFLAPLLVWFICALFGLPVREDMWLHFFFGGYAFGSIVLTKLADDAGLFAAPPSEDATVPTVAIAPPAPPVPPQAEPFRYARWDDEEKHS
jgi:hypothetical protein